jgi:Na+-driven multidrug efflux pump
MDICTFFNFAMLLAYCSYSQKTRETWVKWNKEVFDEWKSYFQIAIPVFLHAFFQYCLEYMLAIEVGFISILFEVVHLTIMHNFSTVKSFPLGIGYAMYNLAGNAIAANYYGKCKKLLFCALIDWSCFFAILFGVVVYERTNISSLFFSNRRRNTSNERIFNLCNDLFISCRNLSSSVGIFQSLWLSKETISRFCFHFCCNWTNSLLNFML